tara:strand:+ start:35 stop:739 length:705 start_codon:yes stop_codon:yes gene_type:complete
VIYIFGTSYGDNNWNDDSEIKAWYEMFEEPVKNCCIAGAGINKVFDSLMKEIENKNISKIIYMQTTQDRISWNKIKPGTEYPFYFDGHSKLHKFKDENNEYDIRNFYYANYDKLEFFYNTWNLNWEALKTATFLKNFSEQKKIPVVFFCTKQIDIARLEMIDDGSYFFIYRNDLETANKEEIIGWDDDRKLYQDERRNHFGEENHRIMFKICDEMTHYDFIKNCVSSDMVELCE